MYEILIALIMLHGVSTLLCFFLEPWLKTRNLPTPNIIWAFTPLAGFILPYRYFKHKNDEK